jgi:mono/diheme cytochrome c family protein
MKKTRNFRSVWIAALVVAGLATFAWTQLGDRAATGAGDANPQLSQAALAGKAAYDANCSECHGSNGAGTDKGRPSCMRSTTRVTTPMRPSPVP